MSCICPAAHHPSLSGGPSFPSEQFRRALRSDCEFNASCRSCCGLYTSRLRGGGAFVSGDYWQRAVLGGKNGHSVDLGFVDFKSVNAASNFVSNPNLKEASLTVSGQDGDLAGVTLSSNGLAVSPELLDGARRVNVIGAGAGASAFLNFCQQSSLLPSAQFWYSPDAASKPVLLSEYMGGSNSAGERFDEGSKHPFIAQESTEETVFVVLGVGRGTGLGTLPGQLKAVQSKGSLAVGIFIQPFMFEGPKRLEQANQLIDDLLECTNMLLVVEQDGLLRRDIVTVSEASSIAKNAVLFSIKAISEYISGIADFPPVASVEDSSETVDDTRKMLQQVGKAWLGSGTGNTAKEAVEMAVAEAPISDIRPFGAKRLVLCTLASALDQSGEEVGALESVLHQTLGPELQLIVSTVKNPMLEKGVKLATIIVTGMNSQQKASGQSSNHKGDEYGVSSMVGIKDIDNNLVSDQTVHNSVSVAPNNSTSSPSGSLQERTSSTDSGASTSPQVVKIDNGTSSGNKEKSLGGTQISRTSNEWNSSPQKPKWPQPNRSPRKRASAQSYRSPIREDAGYVDARQATPQASLASGASQKSRLAWEAGPSSDVAEAWAQARAEAREPTQVAFTLDVSLPVGVRLDSEQNLRIPSDNFSSSSGIEVAEDKWSGTPAVPVDPDARPRNRMMEGLEAVWDMYNAASALVMGKEVSEDSKQASLSQRAASMLESERSQKKLTPIVEMGFKNGSYKGRCQGGLPEGKGRLSFPDGSFYEGQWKQGKRAGSGAFYYTNGDMFQGSWKDDVMHGKGWMYYRSGDRLYSNFWKGKADGEGRFYSAQGDVIFGQFQENWRHGEFLYIEASGVRWSEVWDNGVMISRTPADS